MTHRILSGALVVIGLLLLTWPVTAAPPLQATDFITPTPGLDGKIIYIVQPGDSLWRIAALTGIDLDTLRAMNGLGPDDVIAPGDELFLGVGGPATPIPPSQPSNATPTPSGPTPTPEIGYGVLCVILYNDINGDSMRQEEEPFIPQGVINITRADGGYSLEYQTLDGLEHYCTEEIEEGEYTITAALPEGYNPTTALNTTIHLNPGDETYLDFGAQPNAQTVSEAPAPVGTGRSPLLGIAGGLILLSGIALGIYATLLRRAG